MLGGSPSLAHGGEHPRDEQPEDSSPESRLQAAKVAYTIHRDDETATSILTSIIVRAQALGDVPFSIKATALAYLGEIQLAADKREDAHATFRLILYEDPTWKISPFDHPREVLGEFEIVRREVVEEQALIKERTRKYPVWGYAPFGVPQFQQQRPARGAVYATLQVAFAATSVAAWFLIDAKQIPDPTTTDNLPPFSEHAAMREEALLYRNAMSFPAAAAFYVTWIVSVADGAMTWQRQRKPRPVMTLAPRPGGAALQVAMRW
jgi:hypothetical protein